MSVFQGVHHIAIIASDYARSKDFYTRILGLEVLNEVYRNDRKSWKCDLTLNGKYLIELFSFPNPPARVAWPEAAGLRHLAFTVVSLDDVVLHLHANGIDVEPVRIDPYTAARFTFFADPDGLPIELVEPAKS